MVLNTINLKIAKNKISTVKFVVFSCESTLHKNIDIVIYKIFLLLKFTVPKKCTKVHLLGIGNLRRFSLSYLPFGLLAPNMPNNFQLFDFPKYQSSNHVDHNNLQLFGVKGMSGSKI
jgi:hypothetical protein